jgi:hypothetical protein
VVWEDEMVAGRWLVLSVGVVLLCVSGVLGIEGTNLELCLGDCHRLRLQRCGSGLLCL